jgi:hypothetical protein
MALLLPSLHIKNTNLHQHPLHFNNNPGDKTPKLRNVFTQNASYHQEYSTQP